MRLMLIDLAAFVAGADRRCFARVSTLAIDTGLVRGTLVICATTKRCASNASITSMSRSTFTHGTMINGQALGIGSTLFALASGHAELITTGMSCRTLGVDAALDLGALKFGITFVALTTSAHGLMILDAAFRIQTTIAGISADAIYAGLVRRAIAIRNASTDCDNTLSGLATSAAATNITIGADTDHGTDWYCGCHLTLSRSLTRFKNQAWIDTLFIDAGQPGRTVRVQFANGLRLWATINIRITQEVRWTAADSHVVLWTTLSTWCAYVIINARIDTLFVLARLVCRAIIVAAATDDLATLVGISSITAETATLGAT